MRILRIVYDFPPPWEGLAPGPYELSKAQIKLGNDVTVICGFWPKQSHPEDPVFGRLKISRFLREPFQGGMFFTTAVFAFFAIFKRRLKNRFDLIHGHGHLPFYFHIHKKLFGKVDEIPYFFHLHITAAGREERTKSSGEKTDFITRFIEWPLHKLSDRIGCQVANAVIAVSESVKNEAIKYYGVDPQKIFVAENGVNWDIFRPTNVETKHTPTLLFVGKHDERKNLDKLILSIKYLPDEYKLLTVGRGQKGYLDKLKRLIEKENLKGRVTFAGFIPYPDLPKIYQNADLLVLPSSYEGFPKVVLEALASGVPVLASGFNVDKKITGLNFLKTVTPESIAEEIRRLIEENQAVDVNLIRREYSWQAKAEEIQELYEKICVT